MVVEEKNPKNLKQMTYNFRTFLKIVELFFWIFPSESIRPSSLALRYSVGPK